MHFGFHIAPPIFDRPEQRKSRADEKIEVSGNFEGS